MLRVTINGSSKATSIHRRVPERLWCTASNRVKGNSEQATALNLYIDNIKAKAVQAYSYVKNTEEFPTCDTVMDRLLGKSQGGQQGAIELFEKHLYELQEQVGTSCSPSVKNASHSTTLFAANSTSFSRQSVPLCSRESVPVYSHESVPLVDNLMLG